MKYYAVTEDPNELLHYGVKGMKWGQHIFGDKPKSSGYRRALGKLRGFFGKSKTSSTQKRMNKNRSQQDAYYRKAAKREQENASLIARLNKVDNEQKMYERRNREFKLEQKNARNLAKVQMYEKRAQAAMLEQQAKHLRKSLKADQRFDKILQEAREGRLRYGQLNEDQIQRIQNRLSMEANTRKLGNTEKPSWRQQKKEAFRKGKLSGIEKGTAAAMEEIARAGTVYGIQNFMNRQKLKAAAKQEGKEQHVRDRAKNKKTNKEIREDLKTEAYESEIRSGKSWLDRPVKMTTAQAARLLQENKNSDRMNAQRLDNWQEFLKENNYTDKEARRQFKIKNNDDIDRVLIGNRDMKKQQEHILNEAAYKRISEQAKKESDHQKKIESQEKENAKLKEKYEAEVEQYKKDQDYNKQLKDNYDKEMAAYNKAVDDHNEKMREWNDANRIYTAKRSYGDASAKDPGPKPVLKATKPNKPQYRDTTSPTKPNYHKIDYSMPSAPTLSYDEYLRLRNMGINTLGSGNSGNGKKKK